jgi:O-antigen ligase
VALSVVFLLSALLAVWAAHDRASAWRAFGLILAGQAAMAAIVWLGRRGGAQALGWMSVAMALLAGALGVYFLLSYSWTAGGVKFDLLQRAGLWVQARRPAVVLPEDINANVAAGGLILILCLGLGALLWASRERRWALFLFAGLPWLVGLFALLLTGSRGAWLGMGAALLAIVYLLLRRRWSERPALRWLLDLLALAAVLALAAIFWAALRWPEIVQALGSVPAGDGALGRARLWQDGLDLVADYPFTGSGLRNTMMVHASYNLLIHVGFISHMHNLPLQIAIEQGVMGSAAFLGLLALAAASVLSATRPGQRKWRFGLAAGAALAAITVHGMVDAAVYGSLMLPALFLPIGFALAADQSRQPRERSARRTPWALGLALAAAATLVVVTLLPSSRAALQANLGATAQTRSELALYQWPAWQLQDELRRSGAVEMAPVVARYQAALAENPRNAAANRRLGQIELSPASGGRLCRCAGQPGHAPDAGRKQCHRRGPGAGRGVAGHDRHQPGTARCAHMVV